jgi:hypothetical protein
MGCNRAGLVESGLKSTTLCFWHKKCRKSIFPIKYEFLTNIGLDQIASKNVQNDVRPQFSLHNRVYYVILIILEKRSLRKCLLLAILD